MIFKLVEGKREFYLQYALTGVGKFGARQPTRYSLRRTRLLINTRITQQNAQLASWSYKSEFAKRRLT